MAKNWSGDGIYHLPARKVEPYRLWFEFLKLALKDPEIKVSRKFYAKWGDIEHLSFDEWWSLHWKQLFAVDAGVRVMDRTETLKQEDGAIAVRVPLSMDMNTIIQELRELIQEHGVKAKTKRVEGKFALTDNAKQGFEKRMDTARCMLRLYGYWLGHIRADRIKRVELAAKDYLKWGLEWDEKIKTNRWKRPRPYLPACFKTYGKYLDLRDAGKLTLKGAKHGFAYTKDDNTILITGQKDVGTFSEKDGAGWNAAHARADVKRYIEKARKIAENVGRGQFPGDYK